jgi:integrase
MIPADSRSMSSGSLLKQELIKRRFALQRNPEAYVFGTEDGRHVRDFKGLWREVFKRTRLDYGRSKGLTWHTIRHEFVSRNIENTGDPAVTQKLARHKGIRRNALLFMK